jgi:hypothetical protein
MKITRNFKSVLMEWDKTRRPVKLTFDIENAMSHSFSLTPLEFCRNRAWIRGLFITLMIVFPLFALVYGFLSMVMEITIWSPGQVFIRTVFFGAFFAMFVLLWVGISIPAVIKDRKWQTVVNERGKGNWKIIDDNKWERFLYLIKLAEEKEEEESESENQ